MVEYIDDKYGADADGNRYTTMYVCELLEDDYDKVFEYISSNYDGRWNFDSEITVILQGEYTDYEVELFISDWLSKEDWEEITEGYEGEL